MLDFHEEPRPEACDVCRYVLDHALDCAYEHSRTRVATAFLLSDLEDLTGGSASLSSLAVAAAGVEPGPVHPLEPRHWFWAMFHHPDIRISLRDRTES